MDPRFLASPQHITAPRSPDIEMNQWVLEREPAEVAPQIGSMNDPIRRPGERLRAAARQLCAVIGTVKQNTAPGPSPASAHNRPPWSSTI
jgi:hypothetical protein